MLTWICLEPAWTLTGVWGVLWGGAGGGGGGGGENEQLHFRELSCGQCVGAQESVGKGKAVALCIAQARLLGAARLLRLFGFKDTASCSGLWEPTSV